MAHFINDAPIRVSLPESDEWIEIKARLSHGDREYIQAQVREVSAVITSTDMDSSEEVPVKVTIHSERAASAVLLRGVVNWRLLDEETKKEIAFSRKLLEQSDPEDPLFDLALRELLRLNPTLLEARVPKGSTRPGSAT